MTFRCSVSFESDTQPVETIRQDLEAADAEDAVRRAVFRAVKARRGTWRYRSLAVVVEAMPA